METIKRAILLELEYCAWANRRLLECCAALGVEEQERDLGSSHASIAATLRHIYYTERVWLKRLTKARCRSPGRSAISASSAMPIPSQAWPSWLNAGRKSPRAFSNTSNLYRWTIWKATLPDRIVASPDGSCCCTRSITPPSTAAR
jgi:hypothetical protein